MEKPQRRLRWPQLRGNQPLCVLLAMLSVLPCVLSTVAADAIISWQGRRSAERFAAYVEGNPDWSVEEFAGMEGLRAVGTDDHQYIGYSGTVWGRAELASPIPPDEVLPARPDGGLIGEYALLRSVGGDKVDMFIVAVEPGGRAVLAMRSEGDRTFLFTMRFCSVSPCVFVIALLVLQMGWGVRPPAPPDAGG